MGFPIERPRRLRRTDAIRAMVRETEVNAADLVYPIFAVPGKGVREEIDAMPGVYHLSPDLAAEEAREASDLGIKAVLVFGVPESKDPRGEAAADPSGPAQLAVSAIKEAVPEMCVITDVCLCGYTDHGHCGLVEGGEILNDQTLEMLAKAAVSHARAGADMVAPSDMMDGRVGAIRTALDQAGLVNTGIMAYSAKYASGFYGPFREAAHSAPSFGDRRSYQMDPANVREALREVALDIEEGADIVMVKPALAYLDVVRAVKESFDLPVAAYNVSGEYSMVKAAAAKGWIDEARVVEEILTSMKRAGADLIITYHAKDFARRL